MDDFWTKAKEYMYPGKKTSNWYNYPTLDLAIINGYYGLIKERNLGPATLDSVYAAAYGGDLQCFSWVVEMLQGRIPLVSVTSIACARGHLHLLKELQKRVPNFAICEGQADIAMGAGYLPMCIWLHKQGCTFSPHALDIAAMEGHLDVVIWATQKKIVNYTRNTVIYASSGGDLGTVKYMHFLSKGKYQKKCVEVCIFFGRKEAASYVAKRWYD